MCTLLCPLDFASLCPFVHCNLLSAAGKRASAPIILQTTLAASITAYFERIPWAAVRPHSASASDVPFIMNLLDGLQQGSTILGMLLDCAQLLAADPYSSASPAAALLLRQVNNCAGPSHLALRLCFMPKSYILPQNVYPKILNFDSPSLMQ